MLALSDLIMAVVELSIGAWNHPRIELAVFAGAIVIAVVVMVTK